MRTSTADQARRGRQDRLIRCAFMPLTLRGDRDAAGGSGRGAGRGGNTYVQPEADHSWTGRGSRRECDHLHRAARYRHASTGGNGIPGSVPPTIRSGWQSRPWPDSNRRTRFCRPLPDLRGGPRLRVLHVLYPVGGEACDSLAGQSLLALRHLAGLPSRCRPVGGASLGRGRLPGVGTVEQGDARVRGQTVRTCARRCAENGPASRVLAVPAGRHSTTHWYPGSGKVTT